MRRAVTRIAAALVLILAFTALVIAQSADTLVYATKTGAKYHKASCRHLSRSQIPMTLADASKRYGPCSICKPPILAAATPPAVPAAASTPRAAPAAKAVESGQCQARTKKGTQCSRKAKAGSQYCWQHGGMS
jgi:hypothetical protein